jgi:hypothetical protein
MRMFSLLPLIAVGLFGSGCSSSDTRPLRARRRWMCHASWATGT